MSKVWKHFQGLTMFSAEADIHDKKNNQTSAQTDGDIGTMRSQNSTPFPKRIFVLGLDGATFDLIQPLVDQGNLPNFAALMAGGVYGHLDPAPNIRSAASWTSYYTGKNPGKHGIYEFYDFVPETYSIKFVNGSHCRAPSLWRLLSDQGRFPIVINVPMTYPAEPIKGVILAGLDAPGRGSKGFCHPHGILGTIEDQVGTYILEPGLTGFILDNTPDMAVERLFEEIEQKHKVMSYLMKNKKWDFFTIVYRSLDAAQHCFWKFMDPHHPNHDPYQRDKYGNIISKVYQKLDAILGEIREYLRPDDVLFVISDHGFGPKHPANNQLNAWLASQGYLRYHGQNVCMKTKQASVTFLKKLYMILAGKLPRRYKEVFARLLPGIRNRVHTHLCFTGIDWARTKAYSDTLFANIRINLKGREGKGIVNSGAEYEDLVEEIRQALLGSCDKRTGEKLVEQVFRRDEIYYGPAAEKAPDLTIRWREDGVISGIKTEKTFDCSTIPATRPFIPAEDAQIISGDHRRFGIFFASGPGIKKGKHLQDIHIMDLAPTILHLMNLPVPADMDGRVIESMLVDRVLHHQPLQAGHGRDNSFIRQREIVYSEEDEKAIADRLSDLGYLD